MNNRITANSTQSIDATNTINVDADTSVTDSNQQHIVGYNPVGKNQLYTITDNMSMCTKCSRLFSNAEILQNRLEAQPRSHYIATKLRNTRNQLRSMNLCNTCEPVVFN